MAALTVVVEGPAGSGKSTLVLRIAKAGYRYIDPKIERPRSYDGYVGEMAAITKDFVAGNLSINAGACVLDRWLLSSFVYSAIRRGSSFSDEAARRHELEAIIVCGLGIRRLVAESLVARGLPVELGKPRWLILLPAISQIKARRLRAQRRFPYDSEVEYGMYEWVVNNWPGPELGEVLVVSDNDVGLGPLIPAL